MVLEQNDAAPPHPPPPRNGDDQPDPSHLPAPPGLALTSGKACGCVCAGCTSYTHQAPQRHREAAGSGKAPGAGLHARALLLAGQQRSASPSPPYADALRSAAPGSPSLLRSLLKQTPACCSPHSAPRRSTPPTPPCHQSPAPRRPCPLCTLPSPRSGPPSPSSVRAAVSGNGATSYCGTCPAHCPLRGPGPTLRRHVPLPGPSTRVSASSSPAHRAMGSSLQRTAQKTFLSMCLTSRGSTSR